MTTNSHRDCDHPKTKAARAKCRKLRAEHAANLAEVEAEAQRYHDTYVAPYLEQEALRKKWIAECEKFAGAHINSAEQNADDTAREEGFEPNSRRWCEIAISTLYSVRDDSDRCTDPRDPQSGQAIWFEGDNDYRWVDRISRYDQGWPAEVLIVDREGNRTAMPITDLPTY